MHLPIFLLAVVLFVSPIYSYYIQSKSVLFKSKSLCNNRSNKDDAISRRRQRRNKKSDEGKITKPDESNETNQATDSKTINRSIVNPGTFSDISIEETFGLGNEQLKELLEQELPVPREDLITGKKIEEEKSDKNKVFNLPDLSTFMSESVETLNSESSKQKSDQNFKKVDRSNVAEYDKVLQLNPFADADDELFLKEYDIIPSIFGSGKLLGLPVPFLQSGHGMLLLVICLAGYVYAPGNPLTNFPPEIRSFLRQGLGITYSINLVLAVQGYFNAKSKNLPALFWSAKCFILGGIAYYEITQAKDPSNLNKPKVYSSDRKSKRQNKDPFKK